jgi:hypothetical protein
MERAPGGAEGDARDPALAAANTAAGGDDAEAAASWLQFWPESEFRIDLPVQLAASHDPAVHSPRLAGSAAAHTTTTTTTMQQQQQPAQHVPPPPSSHAGLGAVLDLAAGEMSNSLQLTMSGLEGGGAGYGGAQQVVFFGCVCAVFFLFFAKGLRDPSRPGGAGLYSILDTTALAAGAWGVAT